MSTNRAALLTKIHKALKKHYANVTPSGEQPLLESLLFACCLENAHFDVANKTYRSLVDSFFDWNEVRVTTVKELSEVMAALPDPAIAAARLKGILQTVFESEYSFEIEAFKKQNIGQAVKHLQKIDGATPFSVAYATQTSLGGHSIPLDRGALLALVVLGAATPAEAENGIVAGLERAIPKSKGLEFGSLLHELGADFVANPFAPALRELALSISPDAKERMPKRVKKTEPEPKPEAKGAPASEAGKKKPAAAAPAASTAAPKNGPPAKPQAPPARPTQRPSPKVVGPPKLPAPSPKPAKKPPAPPVAKKKVLSKPLAKRKPR